MITRIDGSWNLNGVKGKTGGRDHHFRGLNEDRCNGVQEQVNWGDKR